MGKRTLIHALIVWLAAWLSSPGQACAQTMDPERIAAVKAGMVVNFVRYTTWPEETFADAEAPIVVTVVGETDIDEALAAATEGVLINGRRVEIRHVEYPTAPASEDEERTAPEETQEEPAGPDEAELEAFYDKLRTSQAVYFGASETDRIEALLEAVKDSQVLTISDIEGFAEKGGMLGLTIRDRRVAFDANEGVIKGKKLQVSSQVLKLARIVKTAEKQAGGEAP